MESEKAPKMPGIEAFELEKFTNSPEDFIPVIDRQIMIIRQQKGGNHLADFICKKFGWTLSTDHSKGLNMRSERADLDPDRSGPGLRLQTKATDKRSQLIPFEELALPRRPTKPAPPSTDGTDSSNTLVTVDEDEFAARVREYEQEMKELREDYDRQVKFLLADKATVKTTERAGKTVTHYQCGQFALLPESTQLLDQLIYMSLLKMTPPALKTYVESSAFQCSDGERAGSAWQAYSELYHQWFKADVMERTKSVFTKLWTQSYAGEGSRWLGMLLTNIRMMERAQITLEDIILLAIHNSITDEDLARDFQTKVNQLKKEGTPIDIRVLLTSFSSKMTVSKLRKAKVNSAAHDLSAHPTAHKQTADKVNRLEGQVRQLTQKLGQQQQAYQARAQPGISSAKPGKLDHSQCDYPGCRGTHKGGRENCWMANPQLKDRVCNQCGHKGHLPGYCSVRQREFPLKVNQAETVSTVKKQKKKKKKKPKAAAAATAACVLPADFQQIDLFGSDTEGDVDSDSYNSDDEDYQSASSQMRENQSQLIQLQQLIAQSGDLSLQEDAHSIYSASASDSYCGMVGVQSQEDEDTGGESTSDLLLSLRPDFLAAAQVDNNAAEDVCNHAEMAAQQPPFPVTHGGFNQLTPVPMKVPITGQQQAGENSAESGDEYRDQGHCSGFTRSQHNLTIHTSIMGTCSACDEKNTDVLELQPAVEEHNTSPQQSATAEKATVVTNSGAQLQSLILAKDDKRGGGEGAPPFTTAVPGMNTGIEESPPRGGNIQFLSNTGETPSLMELSYSEQNEEQGYDSYNHQDWRPPTYESITAEPLCGAHPHLDEESRRALVTQLGKDTEHGSRVLYYVGLGMIFPQQSTFSALQLAYAFIFMRVKNYQQVLSLIALSHRWKT